MASLLPLISELLPMVMPAETHVVHADDVEPRKSSTNNGTVLERQGIVNRSSKMCTSVLSIQPQSSTSIRHNSEQDAILHVTSGTGVLLVIAGSEDKPQRHSLSVGDCVFVPAWTEHQMCNESEDVEASWLVVHGGSRPVGAELADWGGEEISTRA